MAKRKKRNQNPSLLRVLPQDGGIEVSTQGVSKLIKALGPGKFVICLFLSTAAYVLHQFFEKGFVTTHNINFGLNMRTGKEKKHPPAPLA